MKTIRTLFVMLLLICLAAGAAVFWVRIQLSPPQDMAQMTIDIEAGQSPRQVMRMLEDAGAIRHADVFYLWMRLFDRPEDIRAGHYTLKGPMEREDLAALLKTGTTHRETVRVTIPEGSRVQETVERLVDAGLGTEETYLALCRDGSFEFDFLPPEKAEAADYLLEGYLYPDTYEFFTDASEYDVLNLLLSRFDEVFDEPRQARRQASPYTLHEIVTMASIVEREAKLRSERATIAGVFYNRLAQGMAFQSCATVQFLFEEPKPRLLNEDLEIDSPYNTYQRVGLPPGPIASPGIESLDAALWPEDHEYLYFVANEDGSHDFNRTFSEHVEDKNGN